jgi:hypothetical protein
LASHSNGSQRQQHDEQDSQDKQEAHHRNLHFACQATGARTAGTVGYFLRKWTYDRSLPLLTQNGKQDKKPGDAPEELP